MKGIVIDIAADEHVELLGADRREWISHHAALVITGSDRIVRSAVPLRDIQFSTDSSLDRPGIYFLVKGSRIVYVGQSCAVVSRLWTHRKERCFDAVAAIIGIPKWAQNDYEYAYIRAWNPAWNAERRRGYPSAELTRVAEGIDRSFVLSLDEDDGVVIAPTR